MKASTKRFLSIIVSGIFIIGSLVVYANFIRPAYADIQQLRGELSAKTGLLNNQSQAITKFQNLLVEQQSSSKLQERISLVLPPKENVSDIMNQLQAIASANGVSVQSVGLEYLPIKQAKKNTDVVKGLGSLRLTMKIFGSYEAFKNFIGSLETNVRVMDVNTLKVEHAGRPDQNLFTYNLTVDTYYQIK